MIDVLAVAALAVGGYFLGRMLGVLIAEVLERLIRRRLDERVDEAFDSVPRESCVDKAYVDQVFADMTTELPDLRERHAQLSAYYLPGKEDQR